MFRFDESDPRFLIVYTGSEEAEPDDYRALLDRWQVFMIRDQRFGVIMVQEPHVHHNDHRDDEAEINRIINDFRRDYRDRASQINWGFARVMDEAMVREFAPDDASLAAIQQQLDLFAQYNWGVPGHGFFTLEEAKTWLLEQSKREPVSITPEPEIQFMPQRVGLFYGSSSGMTEYVAEDMAAAWSAMGLEAVTPINIGKVKDAAQLLEYDCLILGIPTWNIGQLQDDWDIILPQFDKLDFSGKKVAIFGVGDQYGYPDNFLDAVGILGDKLEARGAELVGAWDTDGYEFSESLALRDGKFIGLGIDETNQSRQTTGRISKWLAQIVGEFALEKAAG